MQQKKILISDYTIHYLYSDIKEYSGGAAVEWYHWIKGFEQNNVRVGVLSLKGTSAYITKKLNYDLIETWDVKSGISGLRLFYPLIPTFYKAIKKYRPNYLAQETARRETFTMAVISKIQGKKFIHRIASDQDVDHRIKNSLTYFYRIIYYWGLKLSNVIFCQNEYQEIKLKQKFPRKKIILLNTPFSLNLQNRLKEKKERHYIAWIGTFRAVKNIPALLEVIKRLPDIRFKIAGGKVIKDFTDKPTELAVKELQKLSNVEFMPYMDYEEVPIFLQGAYALLNTSTLEGFSNTFLESWAAGTPIVSTRNVNPNNIINDYNVGIIAENYDELPHAVMKIVNMPDNEYQLLSQRCIGYVKQNHDAKVLAEKFLEYLDS
jgi:glycosyltransferase involved in cell wall biosynthesis